MQKIKLWEKLALVALTFLYIVSLFLSYGISVKVDNDSTRFLIFGSCCFAINIACFFGLLELFAKHFNYKQRRPLQIFFIAITVIPVVCAFAILIYYDQWLYTYLYLLLAVLYRQLFNKTFGKFQLTLNGEFDHLSVADLASPNTDLKVIAKNKKVKSSTDAIKVGDLIEISKNGVPILTLDVIKNKSASNKK